MCEVKFTGFSETQQFQNEMEFEIDQLLDAAPSDSCVYSTIQKDGGSYYGTIDIHSSEGQFVARGKFNDLDSLEHDLVSRVWKQIRCWKKSRFDGNGDSTGFQGDPSWSAA